MTFYKILGLVVLVAMIGGGMVLLAPDSNSRK